MAKKINVALILGLSLSLASTLMAQQKPDDIPDAPSATRPIPPPEPPSPRQEAEEDNKPNTPPDTSDVTTGSKELPRTAPDSTNEKATPPPMPEVKTVPAGSVPKDSDTGQDVGYTIRVNPTTVLIPVTVKDSEGRLVSGLQPKDFSVLESGKPQRLTFFSSDPSALSAAVIFDTGMPDVGLHRSAGDAVGVAGSIQPVR
jgi:hypothetical protein